MKKLKTVIVNKSLSESFFEKRKLIWIAGVFFIVIYIFFTLQIVTSGGKLAALEKQQEEYTKKNRELTLLIVQSSSLLNLSKRSSDLGFIKPETTFYLEDEDLVAKLP